MTTTGDILIGLSGYSGVPASTHLLAITPGEGLTILSVAIGSTSEAVESTGSDVDSSPGSAIDEGTPSIAEAVSGGTT